MSPVTKPPCKIEGCNRLSEDTSGMYAKLCASHKAAAKESRRTGTLRVARPAPKGALLQAVQALRAPAQRFDRATAKLAQLPSGEKEKAAFDDAARRAQLNPTADNLAALTAATKTLQQGAPRRQKIDRELADAEQELRQSLTGLATKLRTMLPASTSSLDERRAA